MAQQQFTLFLGFGTSAVDSKQIADCDSGMRTFTSVLVITTAVATAVAGSIAIAAIPNSASKVITGCYTKSGALRVIDKQAGKACNTRTESELAWNQLGATGPQGLQGPAGPQGLQGPAGAQGPAGVAATPGDSWNVMHCSGVPHTDVDWSGCDLRAVPFAYPTTNLTRSQLTLANLSGVDLHDAKLDGVDFTGANLSGANLSHASITGTQKPGLGMFYADFTGANLAGANLTGANFMFDNMSHANLAGAALAGALIQYVNFHAADLSSADLSGTDLTYANFSGANLTGANLTGVNWSHTVCPSGANSDTTPRCGY